MKDLVFIGDVHLDRDDEALADFVVFLQSLAGRVSCVVLMGDLFNLWLGHEAMEQAHHRAVIAALVALRVQGVRVVYLEGNRDYRVGPRHRGTTFDISDEAPWTETFGGRRLYAVHGHGLNPDDLSYRRWHRFSRLSPVWGLFHLFPVATRIRWSDAMERRLRKSNRRFKGTLPEELLLGIAADRWDAGDTDVVLGHFHVERRFEVAGRGRLWVLPEWKGSRRHLRLTADGEMGFVDSMSVPRSPSSNSSSTPSA
ncbi:MAG: UDP-2,3-diacylglucosamine diphosphatase [Acidobacteriota bacterium]|nr:UDP-2,3-diacylglucosamine diphosphatase [Acidobacteriota bacterium]MDH3785858.1 UDP-2,3-diacylglucosamine diphosphatase [Acidobacteriota bacterium]